MKLFLTYITILIFFNSAQAGLLFGKDETVHFIEPSVEIPLLDEEGYLLQDSSGNQIIGKLAYITEIQFFFAGLWITDKGYALGMDANSYYPISEKTKENIEEHINQQFPVYQLSAFDYIFGYSLWIVIIGMALFYWLKGKITNRKASST